MTFRRGATSGVVRFLPSEKGFRIFDKRDQKDQG